MIPAAIMQLIDNKNQDDGHVAYIKLALFYEGTECVSTEGLHNCMIPWSHPHLAAVGAGEMEYIVCAN